MMLILVFLTVITFSSAQVNYHADPHNMTMEVLEDNPWLNLLLSNASDDYPSGIEYLQPIVPESFIMVRVIFADVEGPLDLDNAERTRMNLCDILDNDMDHPMSSQRRYGMAASLGLKGQRCPIDPKLVTLDPFFFPQEFATKDLGSGLRFYEMRVEEMNQTVNDAPIVKLRVAMNLDKKPTPATDSSIVHSLSPVVGETLLFFYAIKLFIK